jgi:hypothetical protein
VFEIKGLDAGDYRLWSVSRVIHPVTKKFSVSASKPVFDAGIIIMEKSSVLLMKWWLNVRRYPIKKDTIEYNAGSFKTNPMQVWKIC